MKTIKLKYDKLKKENINYSKLDDAIEKVNRLIHINYLFMRSFLIYSFENNYNDIVVDEQFIRLGFRTIMNGNSSDKTNGRPISKNIECTLIKMKKYWEIFSKVTNINPIKYNNVSYILNNSASEIYTNIINNLILHFHKHVSRCIKSHYGINYQKPNKIFKKFIKDIIKVIIDKSIKKYSSDKKIKDIYHKKRVITFIESFSSKFLPNNYYGKSFEKEVKTNTYQYLKSSYLMNKYIENTTNKTYQFFPIKTSIYNKHITINTSALIDIFIDKHKLKALQKVGDNDFKKIVWNKYFKMYDHHGKEIYKIKDYSFNNEIQINGYTVSLSNIHKDEIEQQSKKKQLMAEGRRKSYEKKKEMTNEEYIIYKEKKMDSKIENDIQLKDENNKKKNELKKKFKQLSDIEKFKIIYEKNLKKEFPEIGCLIKGNDKFSEELQKKYNTGKVILCDPGKNNLLYCINPNGINGINNNTKYVKNFGISFKGDDKYLNYTNKTRLKFIRHYEYLKCINNWKSEPINNVKLTLKDFENKLSKSKSKSCDLYSFLFYCKVKINECKIRKCI